MRSSWEDKGPVGSSSAVGNKGGRGGRGGSGVVCHWRFSYYCASTEARSWIGRSLTSRSSIFTGFGTNGRRRFHPCKLVVSIRSLMKCSRCFAASLAIHLFNSFVTLLKIVSPTDVSLFDQLQTNWSNVGSVRWGLGEVSVDNFQNFLSNIH